MITNGDSDDESDELNHIREKLQRNSKRSKLVQSSNHFDASSASNSDGSISQDVESHNHAGSSDDDDAANLPRTTSKHWNSAQSSTIHNTTRDQSKLSTLANVCAASASWNDDDDDAFDAKLAALNVLPATTKRTNGNPYHHHPRQENHANSSIAHQLSTLSPHRPSRSDSSFVVQPANAATQLVPRFGESPTTFKSSIPTPKSNNFVLESESSKALQYKEASIAGSCEYQVADEHMNWYDEEISVDSTPPKFIASNGDTADPFGFDIETAKPAISVNSTTGSTLVDSQVSKQVFDSEMTNENCSNDQGHAMIHDVYGIAEKPTDEPSQARDGAVRLSEIDHSLYAPQDFNVTPEPIVHYFSLRNRPLNGRKTIPVNQIFAPPVSLLWKNKFDSFNCVQSEIANMLAYSDDNVVISAPTGAGKTAVFEMTMARFFAADLQATPPGQMDPPKISKRRKIVYIAPSKALCEERFADWSKRLSAMNIGIEIAVVTGDGDPTDALHDVAASHFILSTPEKWDSLTRRWTEKFYLFASVKLFLVDEVHLIADESRGCCLESIVCRMKAIQRAAAQVDVTEEEIAVSSYSNTSPDAVNSLLRFVAVSATLPNIADIATFFEANEAHTFDESYRPVPLTIHVIGQGKLSTDGKNGQFMFWKNLDRNVPELVIRYSNGRPAIVFCHSKADCEKLADLLATTHNIGRRDDVTSSMACRTRVSKLQRVLIHGIAFHHAGLDIDDRRIVEESFTSGRIRVLCATSTLAMGVNLPAHLVIIKGTSAYRGTGEGGGYQDIDHASLLQMIGRAGRPSYDSSGTAVIMTDNDSKARIQKLASSGLPPAKSQLVGSKLLETINVEISQRVIISVTSATNWIKGTLHYIQLSQDPEAYGIRVVSNYSLDSHVLNICRSAVDRLRAIGVLALTNGEDIHPLVASHIMSQRLVSFSAMTTISKIPYDASHSQLLKIVAMMDGMQFPVRRSEKKVLNSVHKELKLYKLDGPISKARVQEPWQKAFVLFQAYVEEIEFEVLDGATRQEMNSMVDSATRMFSAIEELSLKGSMNGNVLLQCLKLRRSLAVHLWSAKDGILRQIKGIGKALAFRLLMNGISTFEDVLDRTEAQLEKAASRPQPFGSDLRKASASILNSRLTISATVERESTPMSPGTLTCALTLKSDQAGHDTFIEKAPSISYTLVIHADKEGGIILAKQNIVGPEIFKCVLPDALGPLHVNLIASIVGLDETLLLDDLERQIQPTHNGPTTKLSSKKRIRCANGRQSGQSIETNRSMPNLHHNIAATQSLTGMSTFGKTSGSVEMSYVTPSPQLTPKPSDNRNALSTITTTKLPYKPSNSAPTDFESRIHPTMETYPTYRPEPQIHQYTRTPTHRVPSNYYGKENYRPSILISSVPQSQSASNMPAQADSWNRLKSQQQKSQQRAFVRRSDNPFKNYKYDPNDTESYLDQLASSANNTTPTSGSIIPPEGFHAIDTARSRASYFPPHNSNEILGRRKQQKSGAGLSIREVLSQKAAESNALITPAAQFVPNAHQIQYPTEYYMHPSLYHNNSVHYVHAGVARSIPMDYSVNYHDNEFSSSNHNVYGQATDINQHGNRNIDLHRAGSYANMSPTLGYNPSLQHESQFVVHQSSGNASRGRQDGVQYSADSVDQENTYFYRRFH